MMNSIRTTERSGAPALEVQTTHVSAAFAQSSRVTVRGKFLFRNGRKFYVKGVTYGPFRPEADGSEYHDPAQAHLDFAQMVRHGINTVRTYTIPPIWLLDAALEHDLLFMVGFPWEQHVTFLDDPKRMASIRSRLRDLVQECAGHPAIAAYTIGNEIPAPIARWHGNRRVERFLHQLYDDVKAVDADALVTYVNYPTTEYLRLPFVDFLCFNVYLEAQDRLEVYLARLQNIAGNKPLVMAEIGLDSQRNGEELQAETLAWQVRTSFDAGCAGAFLFAWTDEWHRGGHDIDDWDFGLTRRDRSAKPALVAIGHTFRSVPFDDGREWPMISVLLCSHNGARTIGETCMALQGLNYPRYEIIMVDDGSTDETASIVSQFGINVIRTENRGLSSARNTALQAAVGEIVAYIDDDAFPDADWLTYVAMTFMDSAYVGVGGPNISPPDDGFIAQCVASAPGSPTHVLITDRDAEHIPGCNMAVRRQALLDIGGFDAQFRVAGDDVDICWRLQEDGGTLGFSPAALVWHHRRNSVRAYWKQQTGYGGAEALLEMKWPQRYNSIGQVGWQGKMYGDGVPSPLMLRRFRIYHGVWGSRPFQGLYEQEPGRLASIPLTPEWYLILALLAASSLLGVLWWPFLLALPLLLAAAAATLIQAALSAKSVLWLRPSESWRERAQRFALTDFLYLLQPLARLVGRVRYGLTPWRRRGAYNVRLPWPRTHSVWYEQWQATEQRIAAMQKSMRAQGAVVTVGGDFDRWDLAVRGGLFGSARSRVVVEEHGGGRQLLRVHSWPHISSMLAALILALALLAATAVWMAALAVAVILGAACFLLALYAFGDCAVATGTLYVQWQNADSQERVQRSGSEVEKAEAEQSDAGRGEDDVLPAKEGTAL